ncbi:MAG: hypothetical protein M5R36_01285 [Deltaproteobacteria bacterium]|nr:hypothetical protein [Deltaproteobacteria bacterium]
MLANRARMMAALLAALIGTAGFFGCHEPQDFKEARAYRVKSRSQLIGGPKALGTKNDIIMENDKIRVLINAQPTSMAFTRYGGAILDADLNRYEEGFDPAAGGRDQFGELVPIFDIKGFGLETVPGSGPVVRAAADAVEIVDSGSDGGDAVVRVTGVLRDFLQPLKLIPMPLNGLPVKATTTYTLGTGDAFVKMETTFKVLNEDGSEPETETPIELRPVKAGEDPLTLMFTGDAVGDALFFGNSLSMFGPGVFGFSPEFYIQEEYLRGNSILSDPVLLDWVGGIGDGVGYGLYHPDGPLSFPLMENILTAAFEQVAAAGNVLPAPGSTYTYRRYFIVADGDASGLLDEVIGLSDAPSARLEGHVMYEGGGEPASGVHVHVFPHPTFSGSGEYVPVTGTYEETNEYLASRAVGSVSAHRLIPLTRFETDSRRDDSAADGSFSGKIPVDPETGELHAIVMASGPGNTRSKLYPVRLRVGKKERLAIVLPATGTIDYIIENYDQRGPALPAKLTAVSLSGHGLSDPFLGESFLPASEATISHSVDGRGTLTLPAGRYRLVASRGPEYSTDEAIVSVSPHKTEQVLLYIDRVVDTSGWISGDFHLHANRSTDSGADLPGRVLSFLVEGLEIVASSDHDYITNYRPYVEDFGARDLLYTMPGDELSHLSYGHFNGYPMRYDEREVAGGAPNWRTPSPSTNLPDGSPMPEWTPQDVFDALRERGDRSLVDQDPIVVANHMEESITGYFPRVRLAAISGDFRAAGYLYGRRSGGARRADFRENGRGEFLVRFRRRRGHQQQTLRRHPHRDGGGDARFDVSPARAGADADRFRCWCGRATSSCASRRAICCSITRTAGRSTTI